MNVENIKKVRDLIASRPAEAVKMETWGEGPLVKANGSASLCGTAGCISGWTNVAIAMEAGNGKLEVNRDDNSIYPHIKGWNGWSDSMSAREYLGLDYTDGDKLFRMQTNRDFQSLPGGLSFFPAAIRGGYLNRENQKTAVLAVLDHLIETGDIDWYGVVNKLYPDAVEKLRRAGWSG